MALFALAPLVDCPICAIAQPFCTIPDSRKFMAHSRKCSRVQSQKIFFGM